MADVEANVNINVEGAGSLEEAAGAAEALAEALEEAGAAADEAGAEVSAAGDESAASLAAAKEEAGGLRDKLAEAGITADASAGSLTGLKAASDEAATATKRLRDEQGRFATAGNAAGEVRQMSRTRAQIAEETRQAQEEIDRLGASRESGSGAGPKPPKPDPGLDAAFENLQREMGTFRSEEDKASEASDRLSNSLRLDVARSVDQARQSLREGAEAVENARGALAEAEPYIDRAGDSILGLAEKSQIANDANSAWFDTMRNAGSNGGLTALAAAGRDASESMGEFEEAGVGAQSILHGLGDGAGDAGEALGDAGAAAASAGGIIGGIAMPLDDLTGSFDGFGKVTEKVKGLGMPLMIGGIASAAETILPVVGSLGAGFAAWGALAFPALDKVEQGLSSVTTAQTAYTSAAQLEKVDPTSANAKAAAKDLLALHDAYKELPSGVAPAVSAIQQFKAAWTQAGQKSGIANDALKDIPKLVDDAKGLIPAVTQLAQATNPVVSSIVTDFGRFEKSNGFKQFIGNIKSQIPEASHALHQLGDAFGGVLSQMFSKGNMQVGDSLITSIAQATKALSPGALHEMEQGAKILTGVDHTLTDWAKPGGPLNNAGKHYDQTVSLAESGLNNAREHMKQIVGLNDKVGSWIAGAGSTSLKWLGQFFGNGKPTNDEALNLSQYKSKGGDQAETARIKVQVEGAAAANTELRNIRAEVAGKGGAPDNIKFKVTADTSGAKSEMAALAQYKGASPKIKATVDTAPAKSEMENLAQYKGASAKVKVAADTAPAKSEMEDLAHFKAAGAKIKVTADTASAKSDLESLSRYKLKDAKMAVSVSGTGAASSDLRSVSSAGSAMGSGVAAGAGHATSATSAMAGSMRGTVAPIPGAFHGIGSAAGAGMAAGIAASTGAAVAAARNMASAVEAAAKVQLGVASPSTVFKKIGADTVAGYILGLQGGKSAVETAMNDALAVKPFKDGTITSEIAAITAELNKAVTAGKINPAERSDYVDMLTWDNKKLQSLAGQRAKLESQITKADQLAASVQSAAVQAASLTTVAGETGPGMTAAAQAAGGTDLSGNPIAQYGTIQQGLQANLKSIQTFRQQIIKLKKDGLDKAGIQELLAAGVQQGSATASQILAGGPAAVKQIAQLDNSIGLASKKLGITGGNAAYESGSQIGGQLAAGLKASLKSVNTEMADISKNLVVGIMTALGDSSKDIKAALAKLDKELGLSTGASGGSGGKAGGKSTITPPHIIEQPKPKGTFDQPGPIRPTPPPTVVHPVAAAYMSGASGGSSQPIVITSNITLTVDGQTLSRVVQTKTVARGRRNVGSGLVLPGRGT